MSLPTTSIFLNKTTPAPPTDQQNIVFQSDGGTPQQQITASDPVMVGDTGSGGKAGNVPAPAPGDAAANKFLKADGTWQIPSGGMSNPMTTEGDLIYSADGSGTPARLAAGASGDVLTSNGAGTAPSWQAPSGGGGGSYPSPSTQTGNNTTGVFTFPLSSSYNDYEIRFSGLAVAVNATSLKIQFSTNGGSSYDSSTSDYPNAYHYLSVIGGLGENSANDQTGDNTFLGSLSNASTAGVSGTLRVYATQSSQYKLVEWRMVNPRGDGNTIHIYGATIYQTTSAITNIQISAGSGNFTGGSVTVQPLPQ